MADPLSLAASIAGLVTISAQIALLAKNLVDTVANAPASVAKIREEMDGMHFVCTEVQLFISKADGRHHAGLTMVTIHNLLTTVTGCVMVCSSIDKALSKVSGLDSPDTGTRRTSRTFLPVAKRIKWALYKEEEAQSMIQELQRYKSSLSLMLTIVQW